jgi:hypothetical protein
VKKYIYGKTILCLFPLKEQKENNYIKFSMTWPDKALLQFPRFTFVHGNCLITDEAQMFMWEIC